MTIDDNELERLARELHEEWDSPSLWPRIQSRLMSERPVGFAQLWAFALAAAAILTLTVALLQLLPQRPPQSTATDFLTRETLLQVQRNEAAYARSLEKLAVVAGASLSQSSTPLAAAYREKLLVLDSAIAELKVQMDANAYNAYLRNQLASLYKEKQSTLEEWLKNAKHN